jgi:hypothetical protein
MRRVFKVGMHCAAAMVVGLAACRDSDLAPLPFGVAMKASRLAAAPGDTVRFVVTAQGGTLLGLEADYGDGTAEAHATGGARTARVTFRHAYRLKGAYTVGVTATDATAGQRRASIEVLVN